MKTRKELKEAYKQMKLRMGIFQIRNTSNGKIFLGSSTDLRAVWNSQHLQLELGSHPNTALQQDWKRFGPEHFEFEILEETEPPEGALTDPRRELKALLALYLESLQPYGEKGYHPAPRT